MLFRSITLMAPADGRVCPVTESTDPTFSEKVMGDGIVVFPEIGEVKAPCSGVVAFTYPGGHALGLELEDGSSILLHCGVDTVNLNGKGFTVLVKEGQKVAQGELLLRFDKKLVEENGYSAEILMIVSEIAQGRSLRIAAPDAMTCHTPVAELL